MESYSTHSRIVAEHFAVIDQLARRLREQPLGLDLPSDSSICRATRGLQALFDSIVSASETPRMVRDRRLEEWNPLSQRMLLSNERPISASALEADFSLIPSYVQTFVEWAHEAVHILAMEPWFCGLRPINSEQSFVRWYLAAEGLAFWYADIVVTRAIRETVPTADLVYNRSAVSNTGFHPEHAFRAVGLTSSDEILPVYVAAFLGKATEFQMSTHPFCVTLCSRIDEFYGTSATTLKSLYGLLADFRLFDVFYNRFCTIQGLPSLFDPDSAARVVSLDVSDYHIALGRALLPDLDHISRERIQRVCARRHLQTRAYYAWFLERAIQRGWVFGASTLDEEHIVVLLARYLDEIEKGLYGLAAGHTPESVLEAVGREDVRYETEVRENLDGSGYHMRYRYHIFPYFAPTGGVVGLWDRRTAYSLEEAEAVARFVFERSAWDPELVELLADFLRARRRGEGPEVRSAFNTLLTHPRAIIAWSVSLSELFPARNRFREIAFEFH